MKILSKFLLMGMLCTAQTSNALSLLEGTWKSVDTLGSEKMVLQVYQTSIGTLSAKIITNKTNRKKCTSCKGRLKNKPVKGLVILSGLQQVAGNPRCYNKGKLLDIKTGKFRRAEVKITNGNLYVKDIDGNLDQLWKRVN